MNFPLVRLLLLVAIAPASAFAGPATLKVSDAIRLADEAAKKKGYDLTRYQRPEAHYERRSKDNTWFIHYEGKSRAIGNHFAVHIHDKTRKIMLFRGR